MHRTKSLNGVLPSDGDGSGWLDPSATTRLQNASGNKIVEVVSPARNEVVLHFVVCFFDVVVDIISTCIETHLHFIAISKPSPLDGVWIDIGGISVADHREDASIDIDGLACVLENLASDIHIASGIGLEPEGSTGGNLDCCKVVEVVRPARNEVIKLFVIGFCNVVVDVVTTGRSASLLRPRGPWRPWRWRAAR